MKRRTPPSDWFGFRIVDRKSRVWHGFERADGRSLCGAAAFGPDVRFPRRGDGPCRRCSAIWRKAFAS